MYYSHQRLTRPPSRALHTTRSLAMSLQATSALENTENPMATSFAAAATVPAYRAPIEDVLAHLPISTTVEYRKGQIIYGQEHPSTGLYLMAGGKVKLSQIAGDGTEI